LAEQADLHDELDWNESAAVWDGIPGAVKVWRLYGGWPSMHEARVLEIALVGDTLSMRLYVDEPPQSGFDPVVPENAADAVATHAIITLRFLGVTAVDHHFNDNWLDAMLFERDHDRIVTMLVNGDTGDRGRIVAKAVEVVDVTLPEVAETDPVGGRGETTTMRVRWQA